MAKRRRKGSKRTRVKASWTELRARLTVGTKTHLMSIIKILWSSASITAKNKVIKMAAMKSFGGKIARKVKHRVTHHIVKHRKGKKKAWQIKGSIAAKRHMAKIRRKR